MSAPVRDQLGIDGDNLAHGAQRSLRIGCYVFILGRRLVFCPVRTFDKMHFIDLLELGKRGSRMASLNLGAKSFWREKSKLEAC